MDCVQQEHFLHATRPLPLITYSWYGNMEWDITLVGKMINIYTKYCSIIISVSWVSILSSYLTADREDNSILIFTYMKIGSLAILS